MLLGDIWTAASIELGIRADVAGEKQTFVTRLANEAILELLKRLKLRVVSAPLVTAAGYGDYDLSTDIIRIVDLQGPSSGSTALRSLERLSPAEITDLRSSLSSDIARAYAINGFNMLMLYPTPNAIYNLLVYYVPKPASKLALTGDDPALSTFGGIAERFHPAILDYIYWKATPSGDTAQRLAYQKNFMDAIVEDRREINRRSSQGGKVRLRRRRRIVLRPDQA